MNYDALFTYVIRHKVFLLVGTQYNLLIYQDNFWRRDLGIYATHVPYERHFRL